MALYTIKQLSILSGVKAHTIRIWEKRYNLFSPNRTATNIRRYSDEDLKLALSITQLQAMGYKISQIARLNFQQIATIVKNGNEHVAPPAIPESLLDSAIHLNREAFLIKIEESIDSKGFEWTYSNLIIPFQRKMGELWQTNAIIPAQEHFASNILRDKIISLTSALPKPKKEAKKVLFFLPENEYHELSILYSTYVARDLGFNTIYLGQTVPLNDVIAIGALHKVDIFFISITKSITEVEFKGIFSRLTEKFPTSIIIAAGQQVEQNAKWVPKSIYSISKPAEFKELLKKVGVLRIS